MDPIHSWLDPEEVRRLAERLMKPMCEPAVSLSDAGFDAGFLGYASSTPAAPAPSVTAQAAPETVLQTAPETPTARGLRGDHIHSFCAWMRHNFSATGIFILDCEGAVIFDESRHAQFHFFARSLALAARRSGTSVGNIHVKIGAGMTLEVIPVATHHGCLFLGAVMPDALTPVAVSTVMDALALVVTPPAA